MVGEIAFLKLFNSRKMGRGGEKEKGIFNHLIRIFKVMKENYNFEIRHKTRKCQKNVCEGRTHDQPPSKLIYL